MRSIAGNGPSTWGDLARILLPSAGLVLLVVLAIRRDRRSRRDAAELARRGKVPPPRARGGAWVWVFLVTIVVMITYQLSGKPGRPRRMADPTLVSPALLWGSFLAPAVLVLGFVGLLIWAQRRSAAARALKLANAGDIAGAIALIEGRIAARRGPAPRTGADPYAPPAAAIGPAARRALADDLNTLGALEGMRQDWATALARYEAADALAGEAVPLIRMNRASTLVQLGRVAEGLVALDEVLADLPPADHSTRFSVLCHATLALIELGRRSEARARFAEAEAQAPAEPSTPSPEPDLAGRPGRVSPPQAAP